MTDEFQSSVLRQNYINNHYQAGRHQHQRRLNWISDYQSRNSETRSQNLEYYYSMLQQHSGYAKLFRAQPLQYPQTVQNVQQAFVNQQRVQPHQQHYLVNPVYYTVPQSSMNPHFHSWPALFPLHASPFYQGFTNSSVYCPPTTQPVALQTRQYANLYQLPQTHTFQLPQQQLQSNLLPQPSVQYQTNQNILQSTSPSTKTNSNMIPIDRLNLTTKPKKTESEIEKEISKQLMKQNQQNIIIDVEQQKKSLEPLKINHKHVLTTQKLNPKERNTEHLKDVVNQSEKSSINRISISEMLLAADTVDECVEVETEEGRQSSFDENLYLEHLEYFQALDHLFGDDKFGNFEENEAGERISKEETFIAEGKEENGFKENKIVDNDQTSYNNSEKKIGDLKKTENNIKESFRNNENGEHKKMEADIITLETEMTKKDDSVPEIQDKTNSVSAIIDDSLNGNEDNKKIADFYHCHAEVEDTQIEKPKFASNKIRIRFGEKRFFTRESENSGDVIQKFERIPEKNHIERKTKEREEPKNIDPKLEKEITSESSKSGSSQEEAPELNASDCVAKKEESIEMKSKEAEQPVKKLSKKEKKMLATERRNETNQKLKAKEKEDDDLLNLAIQKRKIEEEQIRQEKYQKIHNFILKKGKLNTNEKVEYTATCFQKYIENRSNITKDALGKKIEMVKKIVNMATKCVKAIYYFSKIPNFEISEEFYLRLIFVGATANSKNQVYERTLEELEHKINLVTAPVYQSKQLDLIKAAYKRATICLADAQLDEAIYRAVKKCIREMINLYNMCEALLNFDPNLSQYQRDIEAEVFFHKINI